MKILVGVKRVVDHNVHVTVKSDGSGVAIEGAKMSVNPFDEIAVEEALRIKEAGNADEVIVVSIGPKQCQEQLRTTLAMGADRAVQVETDDEVQPLTVARVLAEVAKKEGAELVIVGKQAIDGDNGQTCQMTAATLDWAHATQVSEIKIDGGKAAITRETDSGLMNMEVDLPAVVSADLRLNEPRYIKLPDIMKAKKKPMETIAFAELGVEVAPGLKVTQTAPPPKRGGGIKVGSVEELVSVLKDKGLV